MSFGNFHNGEEYNKMKWLEGNIFRYIWPCGSFLKTQSVHILWRVTFIPSKWSPFVCFNILSLSVPIVVICSVVSTTNVSVLCQITKSEGLEVLYKVLYPFFGRNHCQEGSLSRVSSAKQSLGNGHLPYQDSTIHSRLHRMCYVAQVYFFHMTELPTCSPLRPFLGLLWS